MLTFEKVLSVFSGYLQQEPLYEVILTSHGYTLMAWELERGEWYSAELMETPEDLRDALIDAYASFLEEKMTDNDRELTILEEREIKEKCSLLREHCQEE